MRAGIISLAKFPAYFQGQGDHVSLHGSRTFARLWSVSYTIGSKPSSRACYARSSAETCLQPRMISPRSIHSSNFAFISARLSSKKALGKVGESPSRAARTKKSKRQRPPKRQSKPDAKSPVQNQPSSAANINPSGDSKTSSKGFPVRPVHGVTDFLLRGTSIRSPASSSTACLASSDALKSGRRPCLVRVHPDSPLSPTPINKLGTSHSTVPDAEGRAQQAASSSSTLPSSAKPTISKKVHRAIPLTPLHKPQHCALWRVMQQVVQHIPGPVRKAAAAAVSLLRLVMPLSGYHAIPQPALTAANAASSLPETRGNVWPVELGSLTAAAAQRARHFPHSAPCMLSAEAAFTVGWKLDRFASDRFLPQSHSGDLMAVIRESLPTVAHASNSNTVALKVSAPHAHVTPFQPAACMCALTATMLISV